MDTHSSISFMTGIPQRQIGNHTIHIANRRKLEGILTLFPKHNVMFYGNNT